MGDKVLGYIVKLTRESIPASAYLYRWGGEEFLLVLETNNQDELAQLLGFLCEKIEKSPLVFDEGLQATIKVTVSIGGAYQNEDLTIGECILLADTHLYEAKAKGRNKVIIQ